MKNEDIKQILAFVDNAIEGDEIKYIHKIKHDVLQLRISSFFDNKEIIYNFKILKGTIYFYSSNNRYEEANEKLFFDEMLSQCQDKVTE